MEKKQNVLILALCSLLFVPLFATEPIDDVYYWPSQETKAVKSAEVKSEEVRATSEEAQAVKSEEVKSEEAPATNAIEYVNVQDTTVTIKVK